MFVTPVPLLFARPPFLVFLPALFDHAVLPALPMAIFSAKREKITPRTLCGKGSMLYH